jgi:hypothetical protein
MIAKRVRRLWQKLVISIIKAFPIFCHHTILLKKKKKQNRASERERERRVSALVMFFIASAHRWIVGEVVLSIFIDFLGLFSLYFLFLWNPFPMNSLTPFSFSFFLTQWMMYWGKTHFPIDSNWVLTTIFRTYFYFLYKHIFEEFLLASTKFYLNFFFLVV